MKLIAIDIGNSHSKIMIDNKLFVLDYDSNFDDALYKILENNNDNNNNSIENSIEKIIISSVNDFQMKKMNLIFDKLQIKYETVDNYLLVQNIIDFSEIYGMGNDRKLGLIGATNSTVAPFITVDCGTAITINVVDKNLKCLGGVIFPGLNTQAKSLKTFTSQLPQIDIDEKKIISDSSFFATGKNTFDAISAGILSSTAGGIMNFVNSTIEENSLKNVSLLFTGGNGELLRDICFNCFSKEKSFISPINFIPNLVLDGIIKIGTNSMRK